MEYIYCKLDVDGETIIGAVVAQPLSTDEERKAALEKTTGWNKDLWIRNNCGQLWSEGFASSAVIADAEIF